MVTASQKCPEDLKSLLNVLRNYDNNRYVFRGHRDESWPLLPSGWRGQGKMNYDYVKYEKKLLTGLKTILRKKSKCGTNFLGEIESNEDVLAYAQHYGFVTRLLDWTSSPEVALGFACESSEKEDGAIWILRTDGNPRLNHFKNNKNKIIVNEQLNLNQKKQNGRFVRNVIKKKMKRFLKYETLKGQKKYLEKIIIKSHLKNLLKEHLGIVKNKIDIHNELVRLKLELRNEFPTLDFSKHLNMYVDYKPNIIELLLSNNVV